MLANTLSIIFAFASKAPFSNYTSTANLIWYYDILTCFSPLTVKAGGSGNIIPRGASNQDLGTLFNWVVDFTSLLFHSQQDLLDTRNPGFMSGLLQNFNRFRAVGKKSTNIT